MKIIKFRAKTLQEESKWVYGHYYYDKELKEHFIVAQPPAEGGEARWMVDPETVGQYFDRKDVHNIEIFEGDVVRHDDPMVGDGRYDGLVVFDADYGMFCFDSDAPNEIGGYPDLEIVGNAIDDPELVP